MKKVMIIGAGISGLFAAFNLSKEKDLDITVIDKGYFLNGATGRNGAGIRMQWSSKLNCLLSKYSVEFFENGEEHLKYKDSIEFKQKGYLLLSNDEEEHQQFIKNIKLQNSLGIPSKLLTKDEVKKLVPIIDETKFYSAAFCHKDGHLNPFKVSEALFLACKENGVKFHFYEELEDVKIQTNKVSKVITSKATYEVDYLIGTAGSFTKELGVLMNIDIPVYPEKHEILATMPVSKMIEPMIMSFSKNFYIQQVPHGPLIMGEGGNHHSTHSQDSSIEFLESISSKVLNILPTLGDVKVQRQWAGSYDMSPDRNPIISKTKIENFIVACGFSGRGFMIAPATGVLIRDLLLNQESSIEGINLEDLSINRFEQRTNEVELSFV